VERAEKGLAKTPRMFHICSQKAMIAPPLYDIEMM